MSFFGTSSDMGIDLGTSNTLVYVKGKGIVLREPSIVAINKNTKAVVAVGDEVNEMMDTTPGNIVAIRPLKDGVIVDFDATESMLKRFISKVTGKSSFSNPRIIVCFPSGVAEVERSAICESIKTAGAKKVEFMEKTIAAAIGAELPVDEPMGSMVVDIGGGTTDIAVISLSGIVIRKSLRVAGNELDKAIINHIEKKYNLMIGEITVENIKLELGSAFKINDIRKTMQIVGRNFMSGLPENIEISEAEITETLKKPIAIIINAIKLTLEKTPPELSADIMHNGIMITGGGALLRGIDILINNETHIPVHIAESPLDCVALGAGKALEHLNID